MSQTTSADSDPGVTPYSGTGITVETKLMHQYRLASPVHPERQGAAVCNKAGQVELFTAGSDGTVWNFYPDPTSDTGYRQVPTGLTGRVVAAGADKDGNIVVFTGSKGAVDYVSKKPGDTIWSNVNSATLPVQRREFPPVYKVLEIHVRTFDGDLYVAVIGSQTSGSQPTYVALSNWTATPGFFQGRGAGPQPTAYLQLRSSFWNRVPMRDADGLTIGFTQFERRMGNNVPASLSTQNSDFSRILEIISDDSGKCPNVIGMTADTESLTESGDMGFHRPPMFMLFQTQPAKARVATFDPLTYDWIYRGTEKRTYSIRWITDELNLTKLYAVHGHSYVVHGHLEHSKDATHLLCISDDKNLYHLVPDADSPTGYSSLGLPIQKGVEWIAVARNNAGNIEIYCAQGGANAPLLHMTLDQDTGDWEVEPFEVQSSGADTLEEFISYSSDIAFRDAAGMPLANAAVTVNASDRAMITVNNATFAVDAATSHSVTTDATGKLTITQETGGLSVPDLWLFTDKLIPRDHVFVLKQYANGRDDPGLPANMRSVETRLRDVTSDDLEKAKDAKGNFLMKDSVRNSKDHESTKAVAKAFKDCMQLPNREPPSSPAALHPLISRKGCWTGLHVEPLAIAAERSRVHPHPDLPSWSLTFGEDGVRHQRLTSQEAQRMMAEVRANAQPAADADGNSWWSSIGDFLEALVGKFVDAALNFAKLIVDGTKAVFKFVMNSVEYVFDAVVNVVQDAFDMLELILAAVYDTVVDFFERTFEWIGFLFDWPDILRTSDALYYTIDEMFTVFKKAAPAVKMRADARFATAHADIKAKFDDLIGRTSNTTTLKSTENENDRHDPSLAYSLGNNVVGNAYINNCQSAQAPPSMRATVDTDGLEALLGQFAASTEQKPAFKNFEAAATPDKFFGEALKTLYQLLEELILAVVDGTQAIVDKLLDTVTKVIETLQQSLKAELYIPLVSELFKAKIGRPLNGLNLIALVAAIPTTILYKAIYNVAPYPDQASVDAFKHDFTADWMLQASGLGPKLTDRVLGEVSLHDKRKLQLSCGVMTAVFGSLTSTLDLIAGADNLYGTTTSESPWYTFFSSLAFALELGVWGCSCPYIYQTSPHPWASGVWVYNLGGIGLDAYFLVTNGAFPENVTKDGTILGITAAFIYGLVDMLLNLTKVLNKAGGVGDILPTFAEMSKFLLLTDIVRAKPYGFLAPLVVAGLDTSMYGISAALTVINIRAVKLAEVSPLATLGGSGLASAGVAL